MVSDPEVLESNRLSDVCHVHIRILARVKTWDKRGHRWLSLGTFLPPLTLVFSSIRFHLTETLFPQGLEGSVCVCQNHIYVGGCLTEYTHNDHESGLQVQHQRTMSGVV